MVELAGCEKRKFKAICSSIDKLDKEPWSKVREELVLQKGVSEEQADKLAVFV
jgi:histidyl-tRNA synthetase